MSDDLTDRCRTRRRPPSSRRRRASTTRRELRSSATPPTSASAPACTSATPAPTGCTTSSTSWSTTASTRPWPATASNIHVMINVDGSLSVATTAAASPSRCTPKTGKSTLEVVLTIVGAGGKFDKRRVQDVGRPARHGRQGGHRAERVDRGRGRRNGRVYMQEYERGKATTEVKDIGAAGKPHRHHDHLQARPGDLPRRHVRLRHARGPPPRAGVPQQGPGHQADRRAHRQGGDVQVRRRHRRVRRVPQPRRGDAAQARSTSTRPWTTSASRSPAVHRRRGRARAAATPTTPTTRSAARTCPASARP